MDIDTQHLPSQVILQELELRVVSFVDVLPLWRTKLWPGRLSPIKPVSPIQIDLTFDPTILDFSPHFYGAYFREELVATISGYSTNLTLFRSRGLYVDPRFRGLNVSQILFNRLAQTARELGAESIWTLPRKSAWPVYAKFGFYRITDWFEKDMEFGPNCLAKYDIKPTRQV
jgi:GNAT superfamily N-acetyltransferase